MNLLAAAFAGSLLVMPACAVSQTVGRGEVATPPAPASVKDILYARAFTLQRPYRNDWSKARAMVSTGILVVLEVDPALVVPRDALEPVLYAGDVAVVRLNHGNHSGRVIGIIPGSVDLATAPIWFGSPGLPERVTEEVVRTERARAEKAGVRPISATRIAGVQKAPVAAADLAALLRDVAAQLIDQYSPQEKALADQWRLPTAKAVPTGRKP
jgi:hypothetical protein